MLIAPLLAQGAMTMKEVKETEEIVQQMTAMDEPVYVKDVDLSLAKSIHGLRAVFDEVTLISSDLLFECCRVLSFRVCWQCSTR